MAKEKHDSKYWVDKVENDQRTVRDFRVQRVERQWMINHAWYKGLQNLKYDTQLKRLVWDETDPFRFYVNQIYVVVRAIRGAMTRNQPSWEVDPEPYGQMVPDGTQVLSAYLDYLYEKLHIKQLTKEVVMYGLLYSHGIIEYGWDDKADDGLGCQWADVLDPFDVYIDNLATDIQNARHITKCMRKPITEVQKNENYKNTKDLKADGQLSSSEFKDKITTQDYGQAPESKDTIMLKEQWMRDEDGNIRVVTVAGGELLRNEVTDLKKYPFIMFYPDINPNEIYGEGWVKNLVPLNRALNQKERNILEYDNIFSKGRFVADKDAGVKGVTNENGRIYRVSRGRRFEQMDMKPMSNTPFTQIQNIRGYIQDVGAAHEAFLGQTPGGVTASIAIEQLVANNYNNLSDMLDNLTMTLGELGEELLSLGYKYNDTTKQFKMKQAQTGEFTIGSVIGQHSKEVDVPLAVEIPEKSKVRVNVVSNIAHTREARRDYLLQLYKEGLVDKRTVLEESGLGADEILARLQQEKVGAVIPKDAVNAPLPTPPQMPMQGAGTPPEQMQSGGMGEMVAMGQ